MPILTFAQILLALPLNNHSGTNYRFDVSTVELLLWYEAIFGKAMWKHVVAETTFWSHSKEAVALRMQERGQVCQI